MQRGSGNLLLVDDVLATGGTLTGAANLCERAGYAVKSLAVLVDLGLLADYAWHDLTVRTVVHY
jgi:adenine phosphoribosyltransferase